MPEKLGPEIRGKVVKLRREGKTWLEIEKELGLKKGALSHIVSRKWFKQAMKEKGEDGKTGYRTQKEARLRALKQARKDKLAARREEKEGQLKQKKEKKVKGKEGDQVGKEVDRHIQTSDKQPGPGRKEKKKDTAEGKPGDKKGKEEKTKGGLAIVALIVIGVVGAIIGLVAFFSRRKEGKEPGKETKGQPEYDGRPFDHL